MTLSASHHIREQFEHCLAVIRHASVEILLLLNVHASEGKDPRWFLEQLDSARLALGGWGAVAKKLNLNDAEMSEFTLQLRLLQQRVPQYESGQDVSENQLIAAMRFVTALEHLRLQQPLLTYSTDLAPGSELQQQQAHKQVRAIELMIKGLIQQAWPDQVRLNNHLKTLFNADRVRRWLKLGEINDVLSGMMFSELAQLVPVGICHFDRRGFCTFFNDRHLALTGRSREQLIGSRWSEFVHTDDLSKILAARGGGQAPEKSFVCEYRIVRPDGQLTFVIGEVQTEIDADGNATGYIVALTDISLLKATEEKLLLAKHEAEMANRSKTRFLAAASHDLRQPIQAISLFRDALTRTDLSEEQKTISRFLSMSVNSLGELLYSLLDISKLDAGLLQPQMKAVAAEELFATIDAEFSSLARQNGLRFKFFYPGKETLFFTDDGLLMSVLRNLIDNAFKYTTKGGVNPAFFMLTDRQTLPRLAVHRYLPQHHLQYTFQNR